MTSLRRKRIIFCSAFCRPVECRYQPYKWYDMAISRFTCTIEMGSILLANGASGKILIGRDKGLQELAYVIIKQYNYLKGSLTRDFRLQVFFMNQCPPGPHVFHWSHFDFFRKFVEIFANYCLSPVSTTPVVPRRSGSRSGS